MASIKVLMISVRADHGGGPKHIETLLDTLDTQVEFHVACPNDAPYGLRYGRRVKGRFLELPHRRFTLRAAGALIRYIRRHGIDLIHTHGKGAGLYGRTAALITRRPCIHTPHGVHVGGYTAFVRGLYRLYENLTIRWVRLILFVSKEEKCAAGDEGLWPRTQSKIVANGVAVVDEDLSAQLRGPMRRQLNIAAPEFVITTISRFDFQKNMGEAFEVVKAMPTAKFLWVGDGPDKPRLQRQADKEGIRNLFFLGSMDDSYPALAAADLYLTTARWEGLPLAVLEAMAFGLPIIASDVVGHRELMVEARAGQLYPLGKPNEAVELIARLVSDERLRDGMGAAARYAQREKYSSARMASDVFDSYISVLRAN